MTDRETARALDRLPERLLALADNRLTQVVAVVDGLPRRGDADALIAPLRPRLARLRPPRPITLTRLLFEPVAPLIMPTPLWRPGSPGIPRAVLAVLGRDIIAALGAAAGALQARIAGHNMTETATVAASGAELWGRTTALLPGRAPPADWTGATGLPESAHRAVAVPLAGLLAEGPALYRLAQFPAAATLAEAERLLRHALAQGGDTLAMMLVLLLRRLPHLREPLQLADSLGAGDRIGGAAQAGDRVVAHILADIRDAVAPGETLPAAADRLRRAAEALEDLQAAAEAAPRPGRLQQLRAARQQLETECRTRLTTDAAALASAAQGRADRKTLLALEDRARALRRLEAVGRHLGEAAAYDRALSEAAGQLAVGRELPRTARLRLAEILLGPEAALALVGLR